MINKSQVKRKGRDGENGVKKYTPLTDPEFRKSSLAPIPIEFRKQWLEMYTRYHEPHAEVSQYTDPNAIQTITADTPAGGVTEIVTIRQESYWRKSGNNIYYYEGNIAVGDAPNDTNAAYFKGNVLIQSDSAQPYVQIVNKSDTERDPIIQCAVGADPVIRWTHGLDDSLEDDWLLCAGATLTKTAITETYELDFAYDDYLFVADYGNNRIKRHMRVDLTYSAKIGSSGSGDDNFSSPWAITSNGTHVYVADTSNHRIKKHLISDMSYVSKIGSSGSGNDNFSNPRGITNDGTWLYVADSGNNRVQKRLCTDLSYVTEANGNDINTPTAICADGTYVYMVQNPGATYRIYKFLAADMSLVLRVMPTGSDGQIDSGCSIISACTTGGYLYLSNSNNLGIGGRKAIYKYNCSDLTYVTKFGEAGTGDGQFTAAYGIATDDIYLYVGDSNAAEFTNPHRIQKLLLDGTYVSKFGTYGNGDDNFYEVYGLSASGGINISVTVPLGGPILRAAHDATWVDAYPLLRARDGFRLMEDGTADATDYIGLYAPAAITTSYSLTFPGTGPAAAGHFAVDSGGLITWGQSVITTATVTYANITDSGLTASKPVFSDANKKLVSTGTMPVDQGGTGLTSYAIGDIPYASAATTISKLADVAAGAYLRSGGVATAPLWSTLILPNAATAYRLPVATSANTIGELAAVGATGQYLAGNTGAIPSWANVSAFEPALGNPDVTGKVLSSTDAGVRSWVAAGGALALDDLTDVDVTSPTDNDILRYDTATATWQHEALPAGGAHDLLSATHSDTTAAAVVRGDVIIGSGATPKWTRLAKGTATYVLTMGADEPAWAESAGGGAPDDAQYLVLAADADLTVERILSPQGNIKGVDAGAGLSYYLTHGLKYKTSAGTPDDEFVADTLDVKWTLVDGASGTVSLLGSAGNIYDLTTRDSYLLVQAINGDEFQIRQDYTLPDNSSIVLCLNPAVSIDGETGVANNELWVGISLNNNDTAFNAGTYQLLMWDTNSDACRIVHWDGSVLGSTTTATAPSLIWPLGQRLYFRIARATLTYYGFISFDGETWVPIGKKVCAAAHDNLWIFVDCQTTVGTPVPIQAFDWIRQGTNAVDPW